jgi:hypothetical protein
LRTKKPRPPLEKEIQKPGIAYLKSLGWDVNRRNVGAFTVQGKTGVKRFIRANSPGQSDTWGTTPDGRHFELEFKRPGKEPTALQFEWLQKMNARPSTVAFWCDNTATLERVARHVMAGGGVEYTGIGAEYDLV